MTRTLCCLRLLGPARRLRARPGRFLTFRYVARHGRWRAAALGSVSRCLARAEHVGDAHAVCRELLTSSGVALHEPLAEHVDLPFRRCSSASPRARALVHPDDLARRPRRVRAARTRWCHVATVKRPLDFMQWRVLLSAARPGSRSWGRGSVMSMCTSATCGGCARRTSTSASSCDERRLIGGVAVIMVTRSRPEAAELDQVQARRVGGAASQQPVRVARPSACSPRGVGLIAAAVIPSRQSYSARAPLHPEARPAELISPRRGAVPERSDHALTGTTSGARPRPPHGGNEPGDTAQPPRRLSRRTCQSFRLRVPRRGPAGRRTGASTPAAVWRVHHLCICEAR